MKSKQNSLVEKVITLENIPLIDFLGAGNENIRQIAAAFPQSKVVSRGNEIRIQGQATEIIRINDIVNMLLQHFNRFGHITPDQVQQYITLEGTPLEPNAKQDVIVYGNKAWWSSRNLPISGSSWRRLPKMIWSSLWGRRVRGKRISLWPWR
ncbi:hypothetical protein [Nitritalea halalkaliphila]|uniref:hypothetical protein n=1 Tax=Nitritalea halalkaliphila TaxID=590849 RepID=UPI0002D2AFB3